VHGPNYPDIYMARGAVLANFLGAARREPRRCRLGRAPRDGGWTPAGARLRFARRVPDGTVRYYSVSGESRYAPDGRFIGYRGVGRDITEIALCARAHLVACLTAIR